MSELFSYSESMPLVWRLFNAVDGLSYVVEDFVDAKTTKVSGNDNASRLSKVVRDLRQIQGELEGKFPLLSVDGDVISTEESLVWRLKNAVDGIYEVIVNFIEGKAHSIQGAKNRTRLANGHLVLQGIHAELEALFPYSLKEEKK